MKNFNSTKLPILLAQRIPIGASHVLVFWLPSAFSRVHETMHEIASKVCKYDQPGQWLARSNFFTSIQEENAHNHEIAHTEIVEDVESVEQEDIEEPFQCSECDYKCHLVGDLKSHKATGHTFLSWWLTTKTSRRPDNHTTWSSPWQTRLKA